MDEVTAVSEMTFVPPAPAFEPEPPPEPAPPPPEPAPAPAQALAPSSVGTMLDAIA